MPIVRVDGDTLQFPDDMEDAEIQAILAREYPPTATPAAPAANAPAMGNGAPLVSEDPPVNEPDMIDRMGSALGGGMDKAVNAFTRPESADPSAPGGSPAERTQEALGGLLGGAGEAGGEVIGAAWNALPEGMTKPVEDTFEWMMDSAPVESAMKAWDSLPDDVKKRSGEVANIAALTNPTAKVSTRTNFAKKLEKKNAPSYNKNRKSKVEQMLGDPVADDVILDPKGKKIFDVSNWDTEVAEEVAKIQKVRPSGSDIRNRQVIANEAIALREKLENTIRKRGNPQLDMAGLNDRLEQIVEGIPDMPEAVFLVGNAGPKAQVLVTRLKDMMTKSDGTALGVLQVRRDFDTWVRKQNKKVYDPENISAVSFAQKLIRDELNDTVHNSVPSLNLKASLDRQHKLLTASEKLTAKAKKAAETRMGRLFQKLESQLPGGVRLPRTPGSIGMMGAMAGSMVAGMPGVTAGLAAAATLVGGYKGASWLLSPPGRQWAIKMAKAIESDPLLSKTLKADRLALLDLLNDPTLEEEQE